MNKSDFAFSNFGQKSLVPSAINELTAMFAKDFREGIDINLGVGYVNDKTIPQEAIAEAYQNVISQPEKYRNSLNYGGAEGSSILREAIKNYYIRNKIGRLSKNNWKELQINIGANGATSILEVISDILPKGIVITSDPFYYIYTETLERKGFKIIAIPEESDGINIDILKEKLLRLNSNEISFFYLVTVNNPSTVIMSDKKREEICKLAFRLGSETNRLIPIFFDKAYEDIIHDTSVPQPVSGLKYNKLGNVFEIGTLSKVIAPALRIGYIIGKESEFLNLVTQKTSDIGFSASLVMQNIAAELLNTLIEKQQQKVNVGYREKAQQIEKLLQEKLGKYLEHYEGGKAAFYYYITLKDIKTGKSTHFYKFLSRTTGKPEIDGELNKNPRLVYIPGEICSNTEKAKYQLRISYGYEPIEELERAIQLIAEACLYCNSHKK